MTFEFGFGFGFGERRAGAVVPLPVPEQVPLTAGGSLRFPENNNETSVAGFRGFLHQTSPNDWYAAGGSSFAIVHFPRERRTDRREYGVYGSKASIGRHRLSFFGDEYSNPSVRNMFRFYLQDRSSHVIDTLSAVWDENSGLVVMTWDGANAWCDWYSLKDGTRHAGPLQAISAHDGTDVWNGDFLVGGAWPAPTQTNVGRPDGYWPGEIAVVGHTSGSPTTADWQAIAQGADPIATLGGASLLYYRDFDGTSATYGPPAAATADPTPDLIPIDGANLRPGSDFWLGSSGLAFDPVPTRYVFGLLAGQTSKAVTFEGRAVAAHEGATIEAQVFNAETGAVEADWTSVGTVTAGVWSGSVTVPKSSQGWVCARARVQSAPSAIAWMFEPFAVGWKFALIGQSQMEYASTNDNRADAATAPMLTSAGIQTGTDPWLALVKVRARDLGDAIVAFGEQLRAYGDNTPVMVCCYTIAGTSALDMIDDPGPDTRDWADLVLKANVWGTDITAVLWNWGTSDLANGAWSEIYDAVFDGTGPKAAEHNLSAAFQTGFGRILSPLTRATTPTAGPYDTSTSPGYNDREEQIAYAEANGWTVGPYVYMDVGAIGGPHQDPNSLRGNPLVGNRLAVAAARHVGLDTSTNPHLTGTATFDAGKTTITVPVTLPNGGALTAEAPSAITGFGVQDGGTGAFTRSGFTAAISGSDIVLTKTSGAWSAGLRLRFMYGGPLSYGTSGPTEDVLLDGVPHETYALDGLFGTLPLDGLGATEIAVSGAAGGGDTTAPVLSNPAGAADGGTAAAGSVTTDEGNGTLYWVCVDSGGAPSAAEVRAGQDSTGAAADASGSQAVTATGAQTLSPAPSGLTASTAYTLHFMHEDTAANQSLVASGDGFTTDAGAAASTQIVGFTESGGGYASSLNAPVPGNGTGTDAIIAILGMNAAAQATAPANFTLLQTWAAPAYSLWVYAWDGTGARPTSITFTPPSGCFMRAHVFETDGVGVGASGVVDNNNKGAGSYSGPALTSTGAGSAIMDVAYETSGGTNWAYGNPQPDRPVLPTAAGHWQSTTPGILTTQVRPGPASASAAITPSSGTTTGYGDSLLISVELPG